METTASIKPLRQVWRARAVIVNHQEDYILLCNRIGTSHWYLPGGKVESGELAAETVIRELDEKTGYSVRIEAFVGVSEQIYLDKKQNQPTHEVVFYFQVEFVQSSMEEWCEDVKSAEPNLQFEWHQIKKRKGVFPSGLSKAIKEWFYKAEMIADRKPFHITSRESEKYGRRCKRN